MKPTIGRRVWYWPNAHDQSALGVFDKKQPLDAGIAYVWSDKMVNLAVTTPCGIIAGRMSVTFVGEGESPREGESYAAWMPYQVAKAKEAPPAANGYVEAGSQPFAAD